ncbi:MAG: hypothetical protein WCE64_06950 [Bacteroidales bacterium]
MKTLSKAVLALILLQACSPSKLSKYINSEFKDNPASYNIHSFSVGDDRKYDEEPDINCQLDKYSFDELTEVTQGFPPFELSKNGINNQILKTSFDEIASPEIETALEKRNSNSMKFAKLIINISCISFDTDELQATVTGEIIYDSELIWKTTESSVITISDLNIRAKEWNNLICQAIRLAVRKCLNSIPK